MPTWLEKLKATEISLVDRGANTGAVSVLMKRAGDGLKDLVNKISKAFGVEPAAVEKILNGGDVMPMTLEEVTKKLEETLTVVSKLQGRADISDSIGNIAIALNKAKKKKDVEEQDAEVEKLDKTDKRVGVLKAQITELLAKSAKHDAYSENLNGDEKTKFEAMPMKEKDAYMAKNPADDGEGAEEDDDEDGGGDGNDKEVEKRMKEILKANSVLKDKVEKMEKETEIQKIMTVELKGMENVAKVSDLAEAIFKLRKSGSSDADVVIATLKAQAAQLKANDKILQEIGKANGGAAAAGSAEDRLETLSVEKSKKDRISIAKAQALILDTPEGAELYKQMEEEKKTRLGA